jgi:uncharacterized protein (DUF697 family)
MAFTKTAKVHGIIHTASVSAGGIGAGLAQVPGSDNAVITPIQLGMISAIALVHGRKLSEAGATAMLGTFTAGLFGRAMSQWLIGWIPGFGNAVNAATAAGITESIGWAAHKFFERLGDEPASDEQPRAGARMQ